MPFISVTRLRLRSVRFLPAFLLDTIRTRHQVQRAPGFLHGALLLDRRQTFWTLTAWTGEADMRRYMTTGPHRVAMPKLLKWCDEASVVHWEQADPSLPAWPGADRRMRESGRPSKVRHPSPDHARLTFAVPRPGSGGTIKPKRAG